MQPEQATLVALDGHLAPGDGGRGCGNVGQSNIFFNPCRTSSSDRMSKVLKGSWVALRAATTRWLKPHLGSSGVPAQHTSFQTKCCFPNTVSFAKAAAETHLARLQSLLSSRPEGQRQFHAATVPLVVRRVAMMWLVLSHKASVLRQVGIRPFTILLHLKDDVTAAQQLPLDIQLGVGLPFMNSMTGAVCTSLFSLVSSALRLVSLPKVPFVAADVDAVPLLANLLLDGGAIDPLTDAPDPKWLLTFCVSDAASAPSTRPPDKFLTLCYNRDLHRPADTPFLKRASRIHAGTTCSSKGMHAHMVMRPKITFTIAKNGTAVTPYSSEISDSSSAST
ncbi:MAG: hypothetical protein FRX49_01709 [Trebouxia sp. A1-2]|nr:MAG: hypothetical protein FRX49_01709 [Trebouxia sp. A1-2]